MSNELFSKEEALTGFTARRARALLFLIESRTAYLVAQASQAAEILPSEIVARDRDWAFFQAFTLSRQPSLRPTIQNLERYASQWAYLVPENPMLRATNARLLDENINVARIRLLTPHERAKEANLLDLETSFKVRTQGFERA